MKNKLVLFYISLIFIIFFTVFFKGLQQNNIYTPDSKLNNKIPSFSVELFYSKKMINSSEIFGSRKFYLLNIWSSWCVPCRKEHSILMDLTKNENIKIIGINYKDKRNNAMKFLGELGNPYEEIIFDKEGVYAIEWGAYGVPESFLIHEGKIIKRYIGPLDQKLIKKIKLFIK